MLTVEVQELGTQLGAILRRRGKMVRKSRSPTMGNWSPA